MYILKYAQILGIIYMNNGEIDTYDPLYYIVRCV